MLTMANNNQERKVIRMCHVNCQSLWGHWAEFKLYFEKEKYDIICMSETWLKESKIKDEMIHLDNYKIFRNDRGRTTGGSVFTYVRVAHYLVT